MWNYTQLRPYIKILNIELDLVKDSSIDNFYPFNSKLYSYQTDIIIYNLNILFDISSEIIITSSSLLAIF